MIIELTFEDFHPGEQEAQHGSRDAIITAHQAAHSAQKVSPPLVFLP